MEKLNDADFLAAELEMGIGFHNNAFVELGHQTARMLNDIPYESVLDYGAGTGIYASAFAAIGKKVAAFDVSPAHIQYIKKNAPHITIAKKPFTTDLLVWIEVAEHMTNEEIEKLFSQISPKYILFSSTSEHTEWDEKWGHINVKPQSEWIKYFDELGYEFVRDAGSPTSWAKIFKRKPIE